MFFLKFISKFIKVLQAGESPPLIAGGITMGFVVGLTPFWTLQNMVILLVAFLTKVNLASVFFALFVFSFLTYLFDPVYHNLGFFLLAEMEKLRPLWTDMYNWPVAPYTRFNNTVVLGSLIIALVLAFPVYAGAKKGVIKYRETWGARINNSRFMKAVKSSGVYKWYVRIRDLEW